MFQYHSKSKRDSHELQLQLQLDPILDHDTPSRHTHTHTHTHILPPWSLSSQALSCTQYAPIHICPPSPYLVHATTIHKCIVSNCHHPQWEQTYARCGASPASIASIGHTWLPPRLEASVGVIVTMRHGGLCSIFVAFSIYRIRYWDLGCCLSTCVGILAGSIDGCEKNIHIYVSVIRFVYFCSLVMAICAVRHGALLSSAVLVLLWCGLGLDSLCG